MLIADVPAFTAADGLEIVATGSPMVDRRSQAELDSISVYPSKAATDRADRTANLFTLAKPIIVPADCMR